MTSSRHQTPLLPDRSSPLPRPGCPPLLAQTFLSRLQLLLGSYCTASVTVLVSDFCSHGKQTSLFKNLHNTTFLLPGCQFLPSPPTPGNEAAWGAAEIHGTEGQKETPWGLSLLGPHLSWEPDGRHVALLVTWETRRGAAGLSTLNHSTPEPVAEAVRLGSAPAWQPQPNQARLWGQKRDSSQTQQEIVSSYCSIKHLLSTITSLPPLAPPCPQSLPPPPPSAEQSALLQWVSPCTESAVGAPQSGYPSHSRLRPGLSNFLLQLISKSTSPRAAGPPL